MFAKWHNYYGMYIMVNVVRAQELLSLGANINCHQLLLIKCRTEQNGTELLSWHKVCLRTHGPHGATPTQAVCARMCRERL